MNLRIFGAAAVLATLAYPLPAHASFHLTSINEVFAGSQYDGDVQYIEIKAYSGGQNLFNGQSLTISDRNNVTTTVSFNKNLTNSANQMTVLIATPAAAAALNVTPDFTMQPLIDREGGKICFTGVDCFAWGTFNGAAGTGANAFGTKYDAVSGLPLDQAVIRDDGGNGLQSTDDTNDSAADFTAGTPTPRNNAGVTGDYLENCGDGSVGGGEECDDANNVDTDSCTVRCLDAECGDGIVQAGSDACDDGNSVDTDGCRNNCQLPECGDGVVSTGEQCEPPGTAVCTAGCLTINVGCGDGDPDAGEECDDGNTVSGDGCRGNCTDEVCGDGLVDAGEDCDDNNTTSGDGCRADCNNPACGDTVVDTGETCDDGNQTAGDGCDSTCILEEDEHDHDHDDEGGTGGEDDGCASARPDLVWLTALAAALLASRAVRRSKGPSRE